MDRSFGLTNVAATTRINRATGAIESFSVVLRDRDLLPDTNAWPYRLDYDGIRGVATIWVKLSDPFSYSFDTSLEAYEPNATISVSGTKSRFSGFVKASDSDSDEPIAGAIVELASGSLSMEILTDGCGRFQVEQVPAGPLTVTVSKPGFISHSETNIMPAATQIDANFELEPED